jgi:hypothetical protein
MSDFKDLLGSVLPEVKGCPKSVAIREIRNSAIELCKYAPIWIDQIVDIETDIDDAQVELDSLVPDGAVIHKIISLTCDGRELTPEVLSTFHRFDSRYTAPSRPMVYVSPVPNLVMVSPVPDDVYELRAAVSLTPTAIAGSISDDIFNVWGGAMVNGALHRLMRFDSTPWGNAQMSSFYGGLFLQDKNQARKSSVTAHSVMNRTVHPVSFI